MEDGQVLEILEKILTGNNLILGYFAFILTKLLLLPIYKSGRDIKSFVTAATKALNDGVFSHEELVTELRALNAILQCREKGPL